MTKKILSLALVLSSSFILSACSLNNPAKDDLSMSSTPTSSSQPTQSVPPQTTPQSGDQFAAISTKYGQVVVKLYSAQAPKSVANFISKADSGFYNNLTFHRVEPGFVVQGGDPKGNGTGGGNITSEINTIPFVRGSLGLARGMEKTISNDSQFFICLSTDTCQHLTNEYVNFGEVVSGMEFVDKIAVGDKIITISSKTK